MTKRATKDEIAAGKAKALAELAHEEQRLAGLREGTEIEVRDAHGEWHRRTARSSVRIDWERAVTPNYWPSVAIDSPAWEHPINWPAEDVRLV